MLDEYKKKRDFNKTKEPLSNEKIENNKHPIFVIQKHNARRLHYDFRLEHNGVLKSWAIPKNLSDNPKDKRLAVMTEDHPLNYGNFSGIIPKGEYGAGSVEIWDKGKYVNITVKNGEVQDLDVAIEKGHFIIYLKGDKLNGTYAFTKTKENWIVVKKNEPKKVLTQINIDDKIIQITNPRKELDKGITKSDLVNYYNEIAPLMLPHIKDRLISMYRFPDGISGEKFFQKNIPTYFPDWINYGYEEDKSDNKKKTKYPIINNQAGIVYLANQVIEPHIMVNKNNKKPDKMIFDLDPSVTNLKALKSIALVLKNFLESLGFVPLIMTSGGKGYHITVPIKEELDNDEVRDFALNIAKTIEKKNSLVTTELRIQKRENKIFIDVNRISKSQTAIAPYGARARPNLPIACPFLWDELPNVDPDFFTIKNFPKTDAWIDFDKNKVSLKNIIKTLKESNNDNVSQHK